MFAQEQKYSKMKLTNSRILITGGSSGIGLELGKQLSAKGNKVIICGRPEEKPIAAKDFCKLSGYFRSDISDPEQCQGLAYWVKQEHPDTNVIINNAAIVHRTSFWRNKDIVEMGESQMQTNFIAPVRLIHLLHPVILLNYNALA